MADALQTNDDAVPAAAGPSEYVVVARRYRPQAFAELVGQQHVAQALSGAIHSHRVGHAYLFTGARGVGKTSTARIFAKALNCVNGPTDTPCNECDICRSITAGDDVDVIEIDGASNRGIDDIRQLRQNVNVRPSRARFKIYIIDEVHMLSRDAFNALLKTLEEPPEHVKFIFCTTEPEKIPITILSRCQRFDFAGIETGTIAERLRQIAVAEGVEMDGEAIELLARRAAGSMRDSQSLLEQILAAGGKTVTVDDVQRLLGIAADTRLIALVDALTSRNAAAALGEIDGAVNQGVDVGQLLDQLMGYLRDLLAAAVGCPPTAFLYVTPSRAVQVAQTGPQIGVQTLLAMLEIAEQAAWRLKQTTHGRTVVEIALVRICALDDLDALSDLVATLKSGELPAGQSSAPAPRSAAPSLAAAPPPPKIASPTPPAERSTAAGSLAAESADALKKNVAPPAISERATAAPARDEPRAETGPRSEPMAAVALDDNQIKAAWRDGLSSFHDMLADQAGMCERIAFAAPNRLIVTFTKRYTPSKNFCERPEQLARLTQAVSEAAGAPLKIEFNVIDDPVAVKQAQVKGPSQHERIREKTLQPFVKKALEMFDARPLRVDDEA